MKPDILIATTSSEALLGDALQIKSALYDYQVEIVSYSDYEALLHKHQKYNTIVVTGVVKTDPRLIEDSVVVMNAETYTIPDSVVGILNSARAMLVPGKWNKQVFLRSGVKVPIYTYNHYIDFSIFSEDTEIVPDPFTFVTVGHNRPTDSRKGFEEAIAAALLANRFDRRIKLIVKLAANSEYISANSDIIQIIYEDFPANKLAELYQRCGAYINASHGEGWGNCPFEAMACGCPVISTYFGGVTNYLQRNPRNFIEIPHFLTKSDSLYHHKLWAGYSVVDLAKAMLDVSFNYSRYRAIGMFGAESVKKFTLGNSFASIRRCVREVFYG